MENVDIYFIQTLLREIRTSCVELWINLINKQDSMNAIQEIVDSIDGLVMRNRKDTKYEILLLENEFVTEVLPKIKQLFPRSDEIIQKLKEQLISLLNSIFDQLKQSEQFAKSKELRGKYKHLIKRLEQKRYFSIFTDIQALFALLAKVYKKEIKTPDFIAIIARELDSYFTLNRNIEIITNHVEKMLSYAIGDMMLKHYSNKVDNSNSSKQKQDLEFDELDIAIQKANIKRKVAFNKAKSITENYNFILLIFLIVFFVCICSIGKISLM